MTLSFQRVNRPEVIAEVGAAFQRYEAALLSNDVRTLNEFFWAHDDTVRFGLAEHGFGIHSIAAQRAQLLPVHPRRELGKVVITALGEDVASVAAEFTTPDTPRIGRQTQVWARFPAGWRIVCAHVSTVDGTVARLCDNER